MMDDDSNRREHGQWMTDGNPFYAKPFHDWFHAIMRAEPNGIKACEPYAGALGLVAHLREEMPESTNIIAWRAFDIQPDDANNRVHDVDIEQANTLHGIPGAPYDMIITNPPYLARNSARRRGLGFPYDSDYADLYQVALDTCLQNADNVAAIIPESFITSPFDKSRCESIISLKAGLFTDTDCPVCLALFTSETDAYMHAKPTMMYDNEGMPIGSMDELNMSHENILHADADIPALTFNDPYGDVGLHALDSSAGESILFDRGSDDDIPPSSVKASSRGLTRISRKDGIAITDRQISKANEILADWRHATNDVFMTAFKGARKDGKYRRRLAFREASLILGKALIESE